MSVIVSKVCWPSIFLVSSEVAVTPFNFLLNSLAAKYWSLLVFLASKSSTSLSLASFSLFNLSKVAFLAFSSSFNLAWVSGSLYAFTWAFIFGGVLSIISAEPNGPLNLLT